MAADFFIVKKGILSFCDESPQIHRLSQKFILTIDHTTPIVLSSFYAKISPYEFCKERVLMQKKKALHSLRRASIRKETVPEGTVSYYSTGNLREIYANAFAPAALASAANLGSPNSGLCRCLATIRVPVPYAHSSGGLIISAPDPLITLPFSSLESFIHL